MRGDWAGREAPPKPLLELLARGDTEAMAIETFKDIPNLGPLRVPPPVQFQDPTALRRWQNGAPMLEGLVPAFAEWLRETKERTGIIEENVRRLRASSWAQCRLRNVGDYFAQFAAFHRDEWGIAQVCEDSAEREQQVQAVARNGKR